jgi:hypothetical protein
MVIKKIVKLFKKGSSKVSGKSKVTSSGNSKMKFHKKAKADKNAENDWASRSSMYRKMSDPQRKAMDKIINILDKEELD